MPARRVDQRHPRNCSLSSALARAHVLAFEANADHDDKGNDKRSQQAPGQEQAVHRVRLRKGREKRSVERTIAAKQAVSAQFIAMQAGG